MKNWACTNTVCVQPRNQLSSGLHPKKSGQQVESGDSGPFLCSGETHLESQGQFWGPQYEKDLDLLKLSQRRNTKVIQRLELLSYRDKLGPEIVQCGQEKGLGRT